MSIVRRRLLVALSAALLMAGCHPGNRRLTEAPLSPEERALRERFRGIGGIVLRLDALTRKESITIQADNGVLIACPSSLSPANVGNMAYSPGPGRIPRSICVRWRENALRLYGSEFRKEGCYREGVGTVLGDYTVPLAERIPDEVLNYIRSDEREPYWIGKSAVDGSDVYATPIGRALRLKIRLIDDGVLIGWDVEERIRTKYAVAIKYKMPGGDFKEAHIFNGQVVEPGWYIDKHGRRIETDH